MKYLKTIQVVTLLGLPSHCIQNFFNYFSSFAVVALCPVVSSRPQPHNKIIRVEDFSNFRCSRRINTARFQIHQNSPRIEMIVGQLIEKNISSFPLGILSSDILTLRINAMLFHYFLEEVQTNIVSTLSELHIDDFSHLPILVIKDLEYSQK